MEFSITTLVRKSSARESLRAKKGLEIFVNNAKNALLLWFDFAFSLFLLNQKDTMITSKF